MGIFSVELIKHGQALKERIANARFIVGKEHLISVLIQARTGNYEPGFLDEFAGQGIIGMVFLCFSVSRIRFNEFSHFVATVKSFYFFVFFKIVIFYLTPRDAVAVLFWGVEEPVIKSVYPFPVRFWKNQFLYPSRDMPVR